MAFWFGDSFDLYAAPADMITGYWDSSPTGNINSNCQLVVGRFTGSRATNVISGSATVAVLFKSSGQNDRLHHLLFAVSFANAPSGSTINAWFTLYDGGSTSAFAQCSVNIRSDGAIVLVSGPSNGTVLATYTGAITAANTWFAFEVEVNISNTGGYMNVRKNGNVANDFASATTLNTRTTANNYANGLGYGCIGGNNSYIDDLLWRSDASSVPWVGDIRCYTRMPASDASVAWSKSAATLPLQTFITSAGGTPAQGNIARYVPFTAAGTGTIGSVTLPFTAASTANFKCSIFANSAGAPTTVLGSATAISAPGIGTATFTFGTPVSVTAGTTYFVAYNADATSGSYTTNAATNSGQQATQTYSTWPTANPTGLGVINSAPAFTVNISSTTNSAFVADTQQDAANSYVYSSTVGQSDLYTISSIGSSTPASIVGVVTRGYFEKSDAGTRNIAVQLQSGNPLTTWSTTDRSGTLTYSNGNLTATCGGGSGPAARATAGQTTGKYYWEVTGTTWSVSQSGTGFGTPTTNLAAFWGAPSNCVAIYQGAIIWVNGSTATASIGAIVNGSTVCFAVDMASNLVWIRVGAAGNWNGSGTANPATGTGGLTFSLTGGALYPIVEPYSGTESFTANFGLTAFIGTPPAGFSVFQSAFTNVQSTSTALSTVWGWVYRNDLVDPNTSAAWTATAVNNALIGAIVTA